MNTRLLWTARAVADGVYGDGSVSVDDIIAQAIGRPMRDNRNDAPIMLARTQARLRGGTPAEIQRNVEACTSYDDLLDDDYQHRLILAIQTYGFRGQPVYYDGNGGSIYFNHLHRSIYATPGWEGEWSTIPINVIDGESDDQTFDDIPVRFTGDLASDVEQWHRLVAQWFDANLGGAS